MNVKEPHVVTGMSRDSAASKQNPNLAYDARNIRITTKDGKNSVLAVTNERGTKRLNITSGTILGTPIGSAVIDDYIIIFTHSDTDTTKDHIYRCEISGDNVTIATVFSGNAGFALDHPIETLPAYENKDIQKVYWVDGLNQPRVVNIKNNNLEDSDILNFSRELALHEIFRVKKFSTGGEFPTGTVQYAFSYYNKFGQETKLVDVSPLYYLAPQANGLDATSIAHCSFEITINWPDDTFEYLRLYAIVRTSANAIPQCRIVGDYPVPEYNSLSKIVATDDGIKGRTFPAGSMYFIGGDQLVAGTIAAKDNILFLGNIKLTSPNVGDIMLDASHDVKYYVRRYAANISGSATEFGNAIGTITLNYLNYADPDSGANTSAPTSLNKYYDYNQDNNRSSYKIRRFKFGETYRLGFIAQYKNGQWSEPIWIGDKENTMTPLVGEGDYRTGYFYFSMSQNLIDKLRANGFKRAAPVIVYPQAHERKVVMQGLLCPTVYNTKDRGDNSPYAQSSWFFRLFHYMQSSRYYSNFCHGGSIGHNNRPSGEIQCMNEDSDLYNLDGNIVTFHSPDIECVDPSQRVDLEGLSMRIVGFASANSQLGSPTKTGVTRVTDHFLETENVGINTKVSQVIAMRRTSYSGFNADNFCYPLYLDGVVDNNNGDSVAAKDTVPFTDAAVEGDTENPVAAWIVYPWHRQGSLNNQSALSTKQLKEGYTTRTAMLKRNITANAWFTSSYYYDSPLTVSQGIYTPKIFNFDQLASVKIAAGSESAIYYGNIDKVLVSETGKYPIYLGWIASEDTLDLSTIGTKSEAAMSTGYWKACYYERPQDFSSRENCYTGNDPVSMKYKSSPHAVIRFKGSRHIPMNSYDNSSLAFNNSVSSDWGFGLHIAELIRTVDSTTRFGGKSEKAFAGNDWVRCGYSMDLSDGGNRLNFTQGDCYIQRYDCLKTYPFTNEDQNSVIETLSATLETYVNLDFRYDHNRGGGNNIAISPLNFNLYNHPAYEQVNNFFTYHGLDYDRFPSQEFPNCITWTTEKHSGEDVDSWTSLDIGSSLWELDGAKGEITALRRFRNDIYSFQKEGFAQLLFNSRVQIPTSDNNPIEITNGMKMQGVRYISEKIGCVNKWSIVETPVGLYFNDDLLKTTYIFTGQLQDLSAAKGMKSWMNERCNTNVWNPSDFANCRAYYDKAGHDIYWVYDDTALVYSEVLGQYMSFMDYGNVPLLESLNNSTYAITNGVTRRTSAEVMVNIRTSSPGGSSKAPIHFEFTLSGSYSSTKVVHLQVVWLDREYYSEHPSTYATYSSSGNEDTVVLYIYVRPNVRVDPTQSFTTAQILSAVSSALSNAGVTFLSASFWSGDHVPVTEGIMAEDYARDYEPLNAYLTNSTNSPFWELGKGEYNMFFGLFRPYWITLISNSYPTENKIFNNLAWRDMDVAIATTPYGTSEIPRPFNTFDHIRVWTEHQDTGEVRFSNSLSEDSSRQPISYNAAVSNLRKKFNVWHCQIPRVYANNTPRARISNPWAYIKLSRQDSQTERHEIEDIEVDYFK